MAIDFLLERFAEARGAEALVWRGRTFDFGWLLDRIGHFGSELGASGVAPQTVVLLEADYSPNALALLLALVQNRSIIVPLADASRAHRGEYADVAQAECGIRVSADDEVDVQRFDREASHPLYRRLRAEDHPALVLFSSGSTGPRKAAVHDFVRLLEKYRTRRRNLRTLAFLQCDHIGGVDTLLYSLSNASCLVTVDDRRPDSVCAAVQDHRVEVLPVSPSFLNLLILSQAYARYDLRSLKVITYGAEIMPESTLRRCHELLPALELLQKFGTTEVGTLRSKSRASDSTWFKIGGEGFQVRVVDGVLAIKARSAILGYLNAPDPFTPDGWFITGDLVEMDGEYMRVLGRESDVINVGGEKVIPAEVENVIQELEGVAEAAVHGEPNPILGNIVCARVSLVIAPPPSDEDSVVRRIKAHCRRRLERHKVPVKVTLVEETLHTDRFKKSRRSIALGER
jgi:acyl-coenzyme A synthetase/AMP-(fatty) acid ligase